MGTLPYEETTPEPVPDLPLPAFPVWRPIHRI